MSCGTGIGRGIVGGLKSIIGGNIEEFTHVCENARVEAFNRMATHANALNADAIIGMRYDATEFSQGSTEVLAYGTARVENRFDFRLSTLDDSSVEITFRMFDFYVGIGAVDINFMIAFFEMCR